MEGEVIFNKITKKLIYTTRRYKNLSDDQFRFARASNTFKMFSRMLCNGASNGESLISIYKVFLAHIAVVRCPMMLCHMSWTPQTCT